LLYEAAALTGALTEETRVCSIRQQGEEGFRVNGLLLEQAYPKEINRRAGSPRAVPLDRISWSG
jgi:hypothetical protein